MSHDPHELQLIIASALDSEVRRQWQRIEDEANREPTKEEIKRFRDAYVGVGLLIALVIMVTCVWNG